MTDRRSRHTGLRPQPALLTQRPDPGLMVWQKSLEKNSVSKAETTVASEISSADRVSV